MTWTFTDYVDAFPNAAGSWPAARAVEHTAVLTPTAARRYTGPRALISGRPER